MTRVIGRLTKLGLGRETTRGTSVAPTFWIPVLDLGFDDKFDLKDNESGFGNLANIQDSRIVKQWGEGDYSGKIYDRSVGLELIALFGAVPTAVQRAATGVYDNTYAMLQTNQHISLTAVVAEANQNARYPLAVINSWKLDAEVGDYVKRTVNLMSKKGVTGSDTPAYINENEFTAKDIVVKFAAAGAVDATLDSATAVKLRSVSLEINKNADGLQVVGSNDLDDIVNKSVEVTGEFEMYYDDRTYQTLAQAGTHQAMRIEMLDTSTLFGTGNLHSPALRFTMREVALEFPERNFDNNDIMTLKISFRAMLNLTAGSIVEARLTNLINGASGY